MNLFSFYLDTELDELYEEFSHWLDDEAKEGGGGATGVERERRDAAVFRYAQGLLKRALSDSLASVAHRTDADADGGHQRRSSSLTTDDPTDQRVALRLAQQVLISTHLVLVFLH